MVIEPEKAFIMGGTWRIPVLLGLQPRNFIDDLKRDSTFNEASFGREYESRWTGSVENAFFDGEKFDRNRILLQPEYEFSARSNKAAYYVLAVDVGRHQCQTIITVIKVTPQPMGDAIKTIVNIFDLYDDHFEHQAITLKKLYYKYKARRIVIDANGLGTGLIDFMVKQQHDPSTGDILPDFGIYNDPDGEYKKFRTNICEFDAIYKIKANAPINTEAHTVLQLALNSGKIKFLVDERNAKNKLLGTKMGQNMTPEQRNEYLKPYVLTSALKEEMLNLREENEGINIILKQANRGIPKDKFSSLEYGLYYIKEEEDTKRKKKRFKASDFMFIT